MNEIIFTLLVVAEDYSQFTSLCVIEFYILFNGYIGSASIYCASQFGINNGVGWNKDQAWWNKEPGIIIITCTIIRDISGNEYNF